MLNVFQITSEHTFDLIQGLLAATYTGWLKYNQYFAEDISSRLNIFDSFIHLLFLVAGLLKDKAFRKGLVDVYIFHQPIALSKIGRFQNNSER